MAILLNLVNYDLVSCCALPIVKIDVSSTNLAGSSGVVSLKLSSVLVSTTGLSVDGGSPAVVGSTALVGSLAVVVDCEVVVDGLIVAVAGSEVVLVGSLVVVVGSAVVLIVGVDVVLGGSVVAAVGSVVVVVGFVMAGVGFVVVVFDSVVGFVVTRVGLVVFGGGGLVGLVVSLVVASPGGRAATSPARHNNEDIIYIISLKITCLKSDLWCYCYRIYSFRYTI